MTVVLECFPCLDVVCALMCYGYCHCFCFFLGGALFCVFFVVVLHPGLFVCHVLCFLLLEDIVCFLVVCVLCLLPVFICFCSYMLLLLSSVLCLVIS